MDFFDLLMNAFQPLNNENAITVHIQGDGFPVGTLEFYPNKEGGPYCRYTPANDTCQRYLHLGDALTLNVKKALP